MKPRVLKMVRTIDAGTFEPVMQVTVEIPLEPMMEAAAINGDAGIDFVTTRIGKAIVDAIRTVD